MGGLSPDDATHSRGGREVPVGAANRLEQEREEDSVKRGGRRVEGGGSREVSRFEGCILWGRDVQRLMWWSHTETPSCNTHRIRLRSGGQPGIILMNLFFFLFSLPGWGCYKVRSQN